MSKIAFLDKVGLRNISGIERKNQVIDSDINEIKNSVNALYDGEGGGGVRKDGAALTITTAFIYVFFGTVTVWTLPAGVSDIEFNLFTFVNNGTGNITVSGPDPISNSDPFIIRPGGRYTAFWDGFIWSFKG